jgi:hypothetical protein
MIAGAVEIEWGGERLALLPDRAAWLPEHRTLLVADVHLGKSASFRAMGVPVPEAVTGRDLARLSALLGATGAVRLIVLGDLVHDQTAMLDRTCDAVRAWRASWAGVEVDLIPGNHDRRATACERLASRGTCGSSSQCRFLKRTRTPCLLLPERLAPNTSRSTPQVSSRI